MLENSEEEAWRGRRFEHIRGEKIGINNCGPQWDLLALHFRSDGLLESRNRLEIEDMISFICIIALPC